MTKQAFVKTFSLAMALAALCGCGGKESPGQASELPQQEAPLAIGEGITALWDGYVAGYAVRAGKGYMSCEEPAARPVDDKWEPGVECVLPANMQEAKPGIATIRTLPQLAEAWIGKETGSTKGYSVGILPAFVAQARGDRNRFENDRQILILVYKKPANQR